MDQKVLWMGLLVAGLGVAAYAGLKSSGTPAEPAAREPEAVTSGALPPGHPPLNGTGGDMSGAQGLPPGHPAIDPNASAMPNMGMGAAPPSGEAASITWTMPKAWKEAPNPSSMRLATYKIPHVGADTEDAEMSVSQAGGGTIANVDRWMAQFDDAAQKAVKRSERQAGGFKATIVELEGTFAGGSMMGGPAQPKPNWGLIGAIVETPGMAHFFKLTGPAATVKSARADVDALLSSIKAK